MAVLDLLRLLILFSFRSTGKAFGDDSPPVIQTSFGPVQGVKWTSSWTNKTIYSFHGIPYAEPPVGELRFKDPVLPQNWTSIKNCTTDQNSCPQAKGYGIVNNTSEDCLYLNVYSPQINLENGSFPVMVWIHGGAFLAGSGNYELTGPDFLVGEDVVVVTLNYRLGALGFLTLGTAGVPGNAGLKDQNLALKWVQSEINQFGGDPTRVTIFGESAGSVSVHLHYVSPVSRGLFRAAIGDSGSGLANWAARDDGVYYGMYLTRLLNCSSPNMSYVETCMRTVDVDSIVSSQSLVPSLLGGEPVEPLSYERTTAYLTPYAGPQVSELLFIPVIDKNTSVTPFLPDFPINLLRDNQAANVPFLMGINSAEGIFDVLMNSEQDIENVTNNLIPYIPREVRTTSSPARLKQLSEQIKAFYFGNTVPSYSNIQGYIDLGTDNEFAYSTVQSARYYRDRGNVYLYYFSFDGKFKSQTVLNLEKLLNISGVCHAEELNYIFINSKMNHTAAEVSNELKTRKRMVKMWTNFVKNGTPTIGCDPELECVTWSPVGTATTNYLHIDVNLTMVGSDLLAHRMAFWDTITSSTSSYLQATGLITILPFILSIAVKM